MKDLLDLGWGFPSPIRSNDHVIAGFSPGGPAPHITVIKSVGIGQLHRVIARLGDGWQGNHCRFSAQIYFHQGIRVSLLGVMTAVSLGVNTRASLVSVPIGALYCEMKGHSHMVPESF
jgi:hypothetical protein